VLPLAIYEEKFLAYSNINNEICILDKTKIIKK